MNIVTYCPLNLNVAGGVEAHISALSSELSKQGHNLEYVQRFNGAAPWNKVDILHTHGDLLPPVTLRKLAHSWVHTLHGTSVGRAFACKEWLGLRAYISAAKEAYAWHNADGIICVSETVEAEAKKYFFSRNNKPTVVVANGANTSLQDGNASKMDHGKILEIIANKTPYVLFLGRGNDRVKNTAGIINAMTIAQSHTPHIHLLAAPGTGFENASPSIVTPLGVVRGDIKELLIKQSAGLILPSFYEADPLVAWEIMALGKRAILPSRLKDSKYFSHYRGFIFVDPQDTAGIAHAIKELTHATQTLEPVIRDWATVAQETCALYAKLNVR